MAFGSDSATIVSFTHVDDAHNVSPDMEEMIAAEKALLSHPEFIAAVAKLDLPPNAKVVADGWIYGSDTFTKGSRKIPFMCYLAFSDNPDECHYAAPLPIVPVVSADDFSLIAMDYCPIYGTGDKTLLDFEGRFPWEAYTANEYDAGIRAAAGLTFRQDLKPYRVVQPEGASVGGRRRGGSDLAVHAGRAGDQVAEMVLAHRLQLPRRSRSQRCEVRRTKDVLPTLHLRHDRPVRRPQSAFPPQTSVRLGGCRSGSRRQRAATGMRLSWRDPLPRL